MILSFTELCGVIHLIPLLEFLLLKDELHGWSLEVLKVYSLAYVACY